MKTLDLFTEQDLLGDRLVRRRRKRKDADAFLAELQALGRGDLVVHMDHGIGKYLGLEPITVGKSQHDCVMLEYAGGDKLFIPVENLDVLSRYGSSEDAVPLDRLGGEGWQKRKARLKERIRAIAAELLKTAAARALRKATVIEPEESSFNQFVDRFPWEETDDQDRAIDDVLGDLADRQADGPPGLRRCRLRQDRGGAARRLRRGDERPPGGGRGPDHPARPPALPGLQRTLRRFPAQGRAAQPPGSRKGNDRNPRRTGRRDDGRRHRHPRDPVEDRPSSSGSAWSSSTRNSALA